MINILMCGNSGVRDGICLALLSMIRYSKRAIKLYIGTMDLSDSDPRFTPLTEKDCEIFLGILKRGNAESEVMLIDMRDGFLRELAGGKNADTAYTPYAMIRLLADGYCLPDKLLYLDCDIMLLGDIGELYDTDITGYHLAGAKDYYGRFFISPRYLNSGVMLWNMPLMKRDGVLARARKMCYKRKMLLCDQTAINRCAKRKLILPRKYNEQQNPERDTVIQHFSMRIRFIPFRTEKVKPWQPELIWEKWGIHCHDEVIAEWQDMKKEGIIK